MFGFIGKTEVITQAGVIPFRDMKAGMKIPCYSFLHSNIYMAIVKEIHEDSVYVEDLNCMVLNSKQNPSLVKQIICSKNTPIFKDKEVFHGMIEKKSDFHSISFLTNKVLNNWELYGIQNLKTIENVGLVKIYNLELKHDNFNESNNFFISNICMPSITKHIFHKKFN